MGSDQGSLAPVPALLAVDWAASGRVRACMTTRNGGVSLPPFDEFNLGDHVGDDPQAVASNRASLTTALLARPVFLKQVHGTHAEHLRADTPDGTVADACATTEPGVVCTVMVADCLPVLLADGLGRTVAAAHAGWRGLVGADPEPGTAAAGPVGQGVLESVFELFKALSHEQYRKFAPYSLMDDAVSDGSVWASGCVAWLGPCIGPQSFEVGAAVRDAWAASGIPQAELTRWVLPVPGRPGQWLANLAAVARWRLQALGVLQVFGNDGTDDWCTVAQGSTWFSHRRDSARLGSTGRMAACVWLDNVTGS